MAKKVIRLIKLQIPAGKANPAPPVGPALGQHGVNIMEFFKEYNAQTRRPGRPHHPGRDHGLRGPLVHLRHQDAARGGPDQEGRRHPRRARAIPGRTKVGTIPQAQLREIAETKMKDLNANDIDAAMHMIEGTARSMGVAVGLKWHGKKYARRALGRSAEAVRADRGVKLVKELQPRSSTSPSSCTFGPGRTRSTPTSRCAARPCCRLARAALSAWWHSHRATRRARPKLQARTSSAPKSSSRASRAAGQTSTSP